MASQSEGSAPLKEQDIRPQELMDGQRLAMLTDIGRLLSRRREFFSVACPACSSLKAALVFEKMGFSYQQCQDCQTIYINPRPSPEVLEWFYRESANYAYWKQVLFPASDQARRQRIIVPRVDRIIDLCQKYAVEMNSLLEVGAGYGTFCEEIRVRNIFQRVVAVEPTPDLANSCRSKGLETIELPIEQVQFAETDLFNVISSFEVIEHLFSPDNFIRHIYPLLSPGGLLVLTCPNGLGFDLQTLGSRSTTVDHEHLNYFNPESLSLLLSACGFKVVESFTPGKLDAELVRNKIFTGEFDVLQQPFLKRVLVDEWERLGAPFQKFQAQQRLSSHMWTVAEKRG